jgi:hypothetical protein
MVGRTPNPRTIHSRCPVKRHSLQRRSQPGFAGSAGVRRHRLPAGRTEIDPAGAVRSAPLLRTTGPVPPKNSIRKGSGGVSPPGEHHKNGNSGGRMGLREGLLEIVTPQRSPERMCHPPRHGRGALCQNGEPTTPEDRHLTRSDENGEAARLPSALQRPGHAPASPPHAAPEHCDPARRAKVSRWC